MVDSAGGGGGGVILLLVALLVTNFVLVIIFVSVCMPPLINLDDVVWVAGVLVLLGFKSMLRFF